MKKKFIEARDLPEGEKVYLRKSFGEWQVIHPAKNEDGSINKANFIFGGKNNLIKLLAYIFLALIIWYGVSEIISQYEDIAENPCAYCSTAPYIDTSFGKIPIVFPNVTLKDGGDIG